jgi:hypothetical protein
LIFRSFSRSPLFAAFADFRRFFFVALRFQFGRREVKRLNASLRAEPFFQPGRRPMKFLNRVVNKIRFRVAALD